MAESARSPRDELREGIANYLTAEQTKALIDEVLAIRKQAWVHCPSCRKRSTVEVSDARSVASALKDLLAEGFGRPVAAEVEGERIVFQRLVELPAVEG